MINELRNSIGFTNFASAKRLKPRAPYSAKFQPLLTEVEAVRKPDMIEPYSVEQSLRAFDEEAEEQDDTNAEKLADTSGAPASVDSDSINVAPGQQSQEYSGTGHMVSQEVPENKVAADNELDDKAIIDTLVTNLSEKIDTSFDALELSIEKAIEMRLGKALLGVFKQQLVDETSEKLRQSIASIIGERGDAKVLISGPKELIELFKAHQADEDGLETNLSFIVDEASTDLIAQIDEISIASRFDELDTLVAELFE